MATSEVNEISKPLSKDQDTTITSCKFSYYQNVNSFSLWQINTTSKHGHDQNIITSTHDSTQFCWAVWVNKKLNHAYIKSKGFWDIEPQKRVPIQHLNAILNILKVNNQTSSEQSNQHSINIEFVEGSQVLLNGYIRNINKLLNDDVIIPQPIFDLIYNFFKKIEGLYRIKLWHNIQSNVTNTLLYNV